MSVTNVAQTIQLILAPVVMVTACSILLGGLLTRYAAINDRLRAMARERLDLLLTDGETAAKASYITERLTQIDTQIPLLLRRHRIAHDSILSIYVAITIFITDMFVIAAGVQLNSNVLSTLVLVVFLAGTILLFVGVVLTAIEVGTSQRAVRYEVERVLKLPVATPGSDHNA